MNDILFTVCSITEERGEHESAGRTGATIEQGAWAGGLKGLPGQADGTDAWVLNITGTQNKKETLRHSSSSHQP